MPQTGNKYVLHDVHFSYAGIIRIRLLGYNLSPCFQAPPRRSIDAKVQKNEIAKLQGGEEAKFLSLSENSAT
jgi:hypothetical protein